MYNLRVNDNDRGSNVSQADIAEYLHEHCGHTGRDRYINTIEVGVLSPEGLAIYLTGGDSVKRTVTVTNPSLCGVDAKHYGTITVTKL